MLGSPRRRSLPAVAMTGLAAAAVLGLVGVTAAGAFAATASTSSSTTAAAATTSTTSASPNLLHSSTSVYGSSATDWTPSYATVADVTTPWSRSGTVAVASAGSGYAVATLGSGTGPTAASAGQVYTASLSLRSSAVPRVAAPYLRFYSSTGLQLATVAGQQVSDEVGSWTRLEPVVALAPIGTAYVALQVVWQAPAGEAHYVSEPSLTARPTGSRDVVGPLRTVGNKIYDANGPLVLRGLHRFGFEGSVRGVGVPRNFTQLEISRAKAWGANVIRLSLASSYWLSTNCHYDPTYAARVDQAVRWITGAGMVALVDYHWNSTGDCTRVGAQRMADARGATFMASLAKRYKANPLVAFDLYNEPHDISDAVWLNGGLISSGGTTWKATGMQALYNAVRSTGATNLVLVSGNHWANNVPAKLVTGTNVVYGVHVYNCPTSPTGSDCQPNSLDPAPVLGPWVRTAATHPVVVSEFGWPAKNDGRYNRAVIRYAEAHGWGWVAFAWDGGTQGTFDLLADVTTNYEPNATGMPVLQGFGPN